MPAFPLMFCRSCGQEYYGVTILEDKSVLPRELDMAETDGKKIYLWKGNIDEASSFPDDSLGVVVGTKAKKKFELPYSAKYCINCNKLDDACSSTEQVDVTVIPYPLAFCPACNVYYDGRSREFSTSLRLVL